MMMTSVMREGMKRRGGIVTTDVAIGMVLILILLVGVLLGYPMMKDNANRTTAQGELQVIKSALVSYIGLSKNSQPPTDLGGLITGLTVAQSIDNAKHVNFVDKAGWTSSASSFVDPWGNVYVYSSSARTLTSTAGGGTADPIVVNF